MKKILAGLALSTLLLTGCGNITPEQIEEGIAQGPEGIERRVNEEIDKKISEVTVKAEERLIEGAKTLTRQAAEGLPPEQKQQYEEAQRIVAEKKVKHEELLSSCEVGEVITNKEYLEKAWAENPALEGQNLVLCDGELIADGLGIPKEYQEYIVTGKEIHGIITQGL